MHKGHYDESLDRKKVIRITIFDQIWNIVASHKSFTNTTSYRLRE